MKYLITPFLLVLFYPKANAQNFTQGSPVNLATTVAEVSGVIYLNEKVIVHNDSGGANALYEINPETGNIVRTVTISGATNIDWEDLCADEEYIYIGDIGNNTSGNRQNLKVYRISLDEFLTAENDTVSAETIPFAYADQLDYTAQTNNSTEFDAEALIAYNDSLYIFTKNWLSYRCNIYSIPKTPSETKHLSKRIDSFNSNGLVTGADYYPESHSIVLSAYNMAGGPFNTFSYVIQLANFNGNNFSQGSITSHEFTLPLSSSPQIEGVTFKDGTNFYVTAEQVASFVTLPPYILPFGWNGEGYPAELKNNIRVSHLPDSNQLIIDEKEKVIIRIYTSTGQLLYTAQTNQVDLSPFQSGVVIIHVSDSIGNFMGSRAILHQ